MAPSMRVSPAMPFMQPRFMGASQPGMKGYGIGMVTSYIHFVAFVIASLNRPCRVYGSIT
jgi:hypothetical protein